MSVYYLKHLRLVPPEWCHPLGIPAESPTFISPVTLKPQPCQRCGITYSALVYQAGEITHAQHWHDSSGGVYFFVRRRRSLRETIMVETGWFAELELLGKTRFERDAMRRQHQGRAEAVRCLQMYAHCTASEARTQLTQLHCYQPHRSHLLEQGVLLPMGGSDGILVPVCDDMGVPPEYAPLAFTIRNGVVYFRQR
jgi:hypothetical protein